MLTKESLTYSYLKHILPLVEMEKDIQQEAISTNGKEFLKKSISEIILLVFINNHSKKPEDAASAMVSIRFPGSTKTSSKENANLPKKTRFRILLVGLC